LLRVYSNRGERPPIRNKEAAALIKGIVWDVEAYTSPQWKADQDWGPFTAVTIDAQKIVHDNGLEFNVQPSHWASEAVLENKRPAKGFEVFRDNATFTDPFYNMSYRTDGAELAKFALTNGQYGVAQVIGAEMLPDVDLGARVSFGVADPARGAQVANLPAELKKAVDLSAAAKPKSFAGHFVHTSGTVHLGELFAALGGVKGVEPAPEPVAPAQPAPATPAPSTPGPATSAPAQPAAPKPSAPAPRVQGQSLEGYKHEVDANGQPARPVPIVKPSGSAFTVASFEATLTAKLRPLAENKATPESAIALLDQLEMDIFVKLRDDASKDNAAKNEIVFDALKQVFLKATDRSIAERAGRLLESFSRLPGFEARLETLREELSAVVAATPGPATPAKERLTWVQNIIAQAARRGLGVVLESNARLIEGAQVVNTDKGVSEEELSNVLISNGKYGGTMPPRLWVASEKESPVEVKTVDVKVGVPGADAADFQAPQRNTATNKFMIIDAGAAVRFEVKLFAKEPVPEGATITLTLQGVNKSAMARFEAWGKASQGAYVVSFDEKNETVHITRQQKLECKGGELSNTFELPSDLFGVGQFRYG
ncbi:MAG: hypothetical protein WCG78_08775, partial [Candidatus Omnitrophota bacterium]